jgi:NADH-ubiquinone oxidoreductase chain 5
LLALIGFYEVGVNGSPVSVTLGPWMEVEWMDATWGFLFDSLTSSMMVIVTFISTLVHLYSMEYMAHDPHQPRFISYLSLFTFFMIMLITAENFVQMFLGWEGVGLCSYLLINFWFTRYAANKAAIKAMVMNRVGDFGFSLGIFGVFATFHSVDFAVVFSQVPSYASTHGSTWLTVLCLLLFVGAVGKSAQIGLHTWLPDAMEGPTPVSALIHAATMVTAGVFMMIRCSPLFEYAPSALIVITFFGAMTAFFAATTGLLQNDLKKVIAYSTCSQLGYMVFAVGLSQYSISMFHLMNHAYFKALLFLSAGSVIHALADEQDMRRMGGLVKLLPFTYTMILVGSLALMGFPFLTGFYSKDVILEVAYAHFSFQGTFAHWLGCLSAFFTAFYSFRLIFITFFRDTQTYRTVLSHVHEAPWKMALPLGILGVGSIFIGYLTRDLFIGLGTPYWGNAIFIHPDHWIQADSEWIPVMIKWVPFWISVGGSGLALALYTFGRYFIFQIQLSTLGRNVTTFLAQKWFFDRVYNETLGPWFMKWGYHTSYAVLDKGLIEASGPVGAWNLSSSTGKLFHQFHSGYLYHASFWIIIAVSFLFAFLFFPFLQSLFVLPILVILFFSVLFI